VLGVGCGQGSLDFYIAARGARKVLGIDINEDRIGFALRILAKKYPQFSDVCQFRCTDISTVSEDNFDVIVSKDSFEHIIDLELSKSYHAVTQAGRKVTCWVRSPLEQSVRHSCSHTCAYAVGTPDHSGEDANQASQ